MNDTTDPTTDPQAAEHRAKVDALLGINPPAADRAEPFPPIDMQSVESSQIAAIGYDPARGILAVRFNGKGGKPGGLYHYRNFGDTDWQALQDADSKCSHFIRNIKPHADRYPYERVDETGAE